MKLVTEQSKLIIKLIKNTKRYKLLDNYSTVPKDRGFEVDPETKKLARKWDRVKASTVSFMDRTTRKKLVFARSDFNRAKLQIAGW